jgi:hypothetical protein
MEDGCEFDICMYIYVLNVFHVNNITCTGVVNAYSGMAALYRVFRDKCYDFN